ncbi:conserved hypothetical protein [Culex quinquefasciatus]|uniref:Uncharacterized protein n=1 Tax=Culex quinquefasciatus TaxID=7176 RepID=B0X6T9_CULQU|nr:conserved hypothetical protein [Culex quinquefasciatus]|eukprot:XP_001865361.1 conserved hypothetical protein [Culex quinquefasciatus]
MSIELQEAKAKARHGVNGYQCRQRKQRRMRLFKLDHQSEPFRMAGHNNADPNHAAIFAGPNSEQHLPERAIICSVGQHLVADHVVHARTSTSPDRDRHRTGAIHLTSSTFDADAASGALGHHPQSAHTHALKLDTHVYAILSCDKTPQRHQHPAGANPVALPCDISPRASRHLQPPRAFEETLGHSSLVGFQHQHAGQAACLIYNHVAVDDHLFTCEGCREAFGRSRPRVSPAGPTSLVANIWAVIDITRSPPKAVSSDDKTPNSRRRTQLWGSPAFLPAAARASSDHANINRTSGSEKNDKRHKSANLRQAGVVTINKFIVPENATVVGSNEVIKTQFAGVCE